MSVKAVVTNGFPPEYNGRVYVTTYDRLPNSWDKIGTNYTKLQNNWTLYDFSSANYLVVVVEPTKDDMTGTAIAYDVKQLLANYLQTPDANNVGLYMILCNGETNGTFTYYTNSASSPVTVGKSQVPPQQMYIALNSYALTSIPNALGFPYTFGSPSGNTTYAVPDSNKVLQIIEINPIVIAKIKNSWGMMMWVVLLIIIFVVIITVISAYVFYKKRKTIQ